MSRKRINDALPTLHVNSNMVIISEKHIYWDSEHVWCGVRVLNNQMLLRKACACVSACVGRRLFAAVPWNKILSARG